MLNQSIMTPHHPQEQPQIQDQRDESQPTTEVGPVPFSPGALDADSEETEQTPSTLALIGSAIKEVVQIVVPAVVLALVIHIFLAQATVVFGQSMQPNLQPSERLVIEKFSYYFNDPNRNEIVVLDMPQMQELLIKRVIGLPGETVELRQGRIIINGTEIPQPYPHAAADLSYGPVTLDANTYFVLGDNRNNSNDSRAFGPVHRNYIAGRAWLRYWPLVRFTIFK